MLFFKILTHPAVVLASIAMIVIAGEHSAGIFLQFFVMFLIAIRPFAVITSLGLIILFASYMFVERGRNTRAHHLMNVFGILLIAFGVILFLYDLPDENVSQTYTTIIPLLTLFFAALCVILYVATNIREGVLSSSLKHAEHH